MIKNGQYGKFCVVTQLDSTKTIHVSAVALLDTDVCLAVEGCLCGVVVGLALVDTDVCLAAEAWLFGEVAAVALFDTDVCVAVEACLCGVVVGLALLDTDVCLAAEAWLFGVRLQWWLCWILMFVWQQGLGCLVR